MAGGVGQHKFVLLVQVERHQNIGQPVLRAVRQLAQDAGRVLILTRERLCLTLAREETAGGFAVFHKVNAPSNIAVDFGLGYFHGAAGAAGCCVAGAADFIPFCALLCPKGRDAVRLI